MKYQKGTQLKHKWKSWSHLVIEITDYYPASGMYLYKYVAGDKNWKKGNYHADPDFILDALYERI
jgi:hypothetical protein